MELLKCPFCGNNEVTLDDDEDHTTWPTGEFIVVCNVHTRGCGASTGWQLTEQEAIVAWNTRIEDKEDGKQD